MDKEYSLEEIQIGIDVLKFEHYETLCSMRTVKLGGKRHNQYCDKLQRIEMCVQALNRMQEKEPLCNSCQRLNGGFGTSECLKCDENWSEFKRAFMNDLRPLPIPPQDNFASYRTEETYQTQLIAQAESETFHQKFQRDICPNCTFRTGNYCSRMANDGRCYEAREKVGLTYDE